MYLTCGYSGWGLALAVMTNYAADGNGGFVTRALSHPVFTPLSRLTYVAYLVHLICMQIFYARQPAPANTSPGRQALDCIGFITFVFGFSFALYVFVEKPITNILPYLLGMEAKEKRTQRQSSSEPHQAGENSGQERMPLQRELSLVSDLDSESIILSSPVRRQSNNDQENALNQPLLSNGRH